MFQRVIQKRFKSALSRVLNVKQIRRLFSTSVGKQLAYVNGPSSVPLIYDTINQKLRMQADILKDHPFHIFCQHKVTYSYRELNQRVEEIAKGLIALGLEKGDRVGIYSPSRPEWILTQYACARADLIVVNINPAFQTKDLKYSLELVGVKALVMPESFSKSHYVDILRKIIHNHGHDGSYEVNCKELPDLKRVIICDHKKHKGFINFDDLYKNHSFKEAEELKIREANESFEEATNIQFTSGTTGYPKGATLTHHNIMNNGNQVALTMGYNTETKVCLPVPLYHCFGMVMGNLACLNSGATAVWPCEGFNARDALKAIDSEGCHSVYGVPTMFNGYLKEFRDNPGKYKLKNLDRGIMAGSICPEELMKRCNTELGIKNLSICYGMTETSPVSYQTLPSHPFHKQVTTVGQVHPHVEVKICNENGVTLKRGEKGEICTRGYSVMLKYWGDEEKTQQVIDSKGWCHSGDLGVMDDEGFLEIVGRVKDMIIRGGENIFPKEIENHLLTHPKILDAQCIAVRDEKLGEEIMACILLNDPEDVISHSEVYDFCHGQIAHYKIPRYIRIVKEYPLTVTGKIKKNVMRDENNKILSEVNQDLWESEYNIFTS